MRKRLIIILSIISIACSPPCHAALPEEADSGIATDGMSAADSVGDADSIGVADSDFDIRVNPDINLQELASRPDVNYADYPFLRLQANRISLNGADWNALKELFAASADTAISIVHIGDSHVQAEMGTSRTRGMLADKYGSRGRGLIIPFRLAGTNQPVDYSIESKSRFEVAKIMKKPWPIEMGFTGIALRPKDARFSFDISVKNQGFEAIRLYYRGEAPRLHAATTEGVDNLFEYSVKGDTITAYLNQSVSSINLDFASQGRCQIYGFDLDNMENGVKYSSIGNNGATFSSYCAIPGMADDVNRLEPHLIIVSLGTNDAFGRNDAETIYHSIDLMVKDLNRACPGAQLLLVTPAECQKSVRKRVGKGKRRRWSRVYSVNNKVAEVRDLVLRYGQEHGIATYDWYEVAGGKGASPLWVGQGLMAKDRIHCGPTGYALQGSLFFDALDQEISHRAEE
ncbi:MAG: GDSL-type esterase/lipase family protein [Clostridium sp.]|nr:GDSL-type esterase/lipase family protein [Clostridium sp.]